MNTCEDKTRKPGTKTRSGKGSGRDRGKVRARSAKDAVAFLAACDGPDAPAVSTDCGINSTVVRLWTGRPAGAGAPWSRPGPVWVADCDCFDDACCICC